MEAPKFINGTKVNEEDYDKKKDLKGDNRAWNNDYMKNIVAKTSNYNVTDAFITDGKEYLQLR